MTLTPDYLHRFLLERAHVSGVLVRLESSWQEISQRAEYPEPIARMLAEMLAASALLTGNIKFQGGLSIQLKGAAPLTLMFAECSHQGKLRGLARWQGEIKDGFSLAANPNATLTITIENTKAGQRYQGFVPVENSNFATMLEHYFERSEQLPTLIVLASDGVRCAGMMLQKVALDEDPNVVPDSDAWQRIGLLLKTLTEGELLSLPADTLLMRLFHEELVRLYEPQMLEFHCRCSRERVAGMLRSLGRAEADAALREDGVAEIICEFCNAHYRFDRVDMEQVFSDQPPIPGSLSAH